MDTQTVVIGGGVTGVGIARDLALRGVDVTLLERGRLTAGTSGRTHGLLHSGARYAVTDQTSAADCMAENLVLREIAPHCITDTGGLFVALREDDPGYFERKLVDCGDCGIPAEPIPGEEAREMEPGLAPGVQQALRVPDATVDPFALTAATALGAEDAGAEVRTGVEVVDLHRKGDRVARVDVRSTDGGGPESIETAHVVNATGAWAPKIAALADLEIDLQLTRGAMTVVEPVDTDMVVNRCRPRSEGDIVVPWGDAGVLGTTESPIDDPDDFTTPPDAADFLVDELSPMVPSVAEGTVRRTYWGVRPLNDAAAEASRDFRVIDHEACDGVAGLTSVVGGKLTTHRLMAERTADVVADHLDVTHPCRTDETPLPGARDGVDVADSLARFGITGEVETAPW